MQIRRALNFFRKRPTTELVIGNSGAALNTHDSDLEAKENELTGGQNMVPASDTSYKKRSGIELYGNFLGTTSGVLGAWNFVDEKGVQEQLCVYGTQLYRYVAGNWMAVANATFTANKQADGTYFSFTDKFYIVNQTDNVVKLQTGQVADQSDSSFKKGKYIIASQNRLLVANTSTAPTRVWYTDNQLDTFGVNNWFEVDGNITGMIAYYDKILIFTEEKVFRLSGFKFDGTDTWADKLYELPTRFGAIIDKTIQVVNGFVYFLGQDMNDIAAIYMCDAYKVYPITTEKISATMQALSSAQIDNACAVTDGQNYHLFAADLGDTTNTTGIVYDTVRKYCYPVEKRIVEGISDMACMFSSETNGKWAAYGGTQGTGQIYKIHGNDGLYDELPEERYLTQGSYSLQINANPAGRGAQSFKMHNYNTSEKVFINKVSVQLKKNTGTTTDLTVRIETDNNGKPSGTLVATGASGTISAFSDTSYLWKTVTLTTPPELTGNTTYWLVIQHATEGSGTSQYYWLGDVCTATYGYGNLATYGQTVTAATQTYNPGATAIDGYVSWFDPFGNGEVFSTIRSEPVAITAQTSSLFVGISTRDVANSFVSLQRSYILFDTSALPDDAVITSAVLSVYMNSRTDDGGAPINISAGTPASDTALVQADFAVAQFGSTKFSSDKYIIGMTLNAYNDFTLNASGLAVISKTGLSRFALRMAGDITNTAITMATNKGSYAAFHSAANTNKPRLTITFTSVTGAALWNSDPATAQTFVIYAQSPIDAFADHKCYMPTNGKLVKIHRFQSIFSRSGDFNVEMGFYTGDYGSIRNFNVSMKSGESAEWGDGTAKWGDGSTIWGGTKQRVYAWTNINSFVNRTVKLRVRNRNANQQIEFNRAILQLSPSFRNA